MEQDQQPVSELSLPEALSCAVQLHQKGYLPAAETIYRRILELIPNHPDALHFLGVLMYQMGKSEVAIELINQAITLVPDHADAHTNLGNVFLELGRPEEAAACYRRVIAIKPEHIDAYNNLGLVLKNQGRLEEAVATFRKAIALNPDRADTYHNLGNALRQQGKIQEAIACYSTAIVLNPHDPEAKKLLGAALYTLGRIEEAAEHYRQWLSREPDNPIALHLLAACSGQNIPARASDEYIQHTFDRFATSFDAKLHNLDYRAPELVAAAVAKEVDVAQKQLNVLDAGCGTGLCGPLLRPYARCLVGVDLSAGMLNKARERGLYEELVQAELTAFLNSRMECYDLIVSADTLVYIGDLEPVFTAAARALQAGGLLVFTVEHAVGQAPEGGFRLEPHGRYSHTEPYLRQALATAGLTVRSITSVHLRMENGFVA